MSQQSRRDKIETLLLESPDDTFLLYGLAIELLQGGETEEAIRRFEEVVKKDGDYHAAHFRLGQLFAEENELEKARSWIAEGIAAAHRTGNAHAVEEMTQLLETL